MVVLAITWYIKVELLRTKQLPSYMTFSCIDRVPGLQAEIKKKASTLYTDLYRKNDTINKFVFSDTGRKHMDGKIGVISSYDASTSQYIAYVSGSSQSDSALTSVSIEQMEPLSRFRFPSKYRPAASEESCHVVIESPFHTDSCKSYTINFSASAFIEIDGLSGSPQTKGCLERDRLVKIIDRIESTAKDRAENVRVQQSQLEEALSKLHSTRSPVEVRPRKKVRNTRNISLRSKSDQVRHVWKAKVEHHISQNSHDSTTKGDRHQDEHMFTFPFATQDNTLHCSCDGLTEFSYHGDRTGINDNVYERKNLASSIIIDDASVRSLTPGSVMDSDILNFCLSWYVLIICHVTLIDTPISSFNYSHVDLLKWFQGVCWCY